MNSIQETALLQELGLSRSLESEKDRNELGQEDFLTLMTAQLKNQDPFEPLDNREFLGQLTQMQTLDATTALTESLQAVVLGQQVTQASSMIGRFVEGLNTSGFPVEGIVDRVIVQGDEVLLGVGESTVSISKVTELRTAPVSEEPGTE